MLDKRTRLRLGESLRIKLITFVRKTQYLSSKKQEYLQNLIPGNQNWQKVIIVLKKTNNLTYTIPMQSFADDTEQLNKIELPNLEKNNNYSRRPIWEIIVELGEEIPDEEWEKVPPDASMNYKQYLYGINQKTP